MVVLLGERPTPNAVVTAIEKEIVDAVPAVLARGYPWVTLSYAQSVDGSITRKRGEPTALSGAESLQLTHELRARHDAILVGAGTLRADDPRLTTRLASGGDPRPVVLDHTLSTQPEARIFAGYRRPILICGSHAYSERGEELEAAGAECEVVPRDTALDTVLRRLASYGIESVMVEGGGEVIASFVSQSMIDIAVVTIAPVYLGGYKPSFNDIERRLVRQSIYDVGGDVVLVGKFE